jgi:hypothetical protein
MSVKVSVGECVAVQDPLIWEETASDLGIRVEFDVQGTRVVMDENRHLVFFPDRPYGHDSRTTFESGRVEYRFGTNFQNIDTSYAGIDSLLFMSDCNDAMNFAKQGNGNQARRIYRACMDVLTATIDQGTIYDVPPTVLPCFTELAQVIFDMPLKKIGHVTSHVAVTA